MIRILQVLEATAGGTRRYLREVVAHLPRNEFELSIACSVDRDMAFADDIAVFRAQGIHVHVLDMARRPDVIKDARAVAALRKIITASNCQVVHLHSAKAGALGRLAAFGLDCTVLYSPHAFPFLQSGSLGAFSAIAEKLLAPLTDRVVAVSHAEGELAVRSGLFPPAMVRVLPNSVDAKQCGGHEDGPRPFRTAEEGRTFGLLGELRAQKNPLLFLEGVRRFLRRGGKARFALPARGQQLRTVLEFMRVHGLEAQVDLLPTSTSLQPILRRVDVGVLCSDYEGLPYALLDAFCSKRPVIASDIPVFESIVGRIDKRLLFAHGDPDALADALQCWATLPAECLADVAEVAYAITLKNHDVANWSTSLAHLYREAVGTA